MEGYTQLEDEFGDVVGKARRGQERTVEELAAAAGIGAGDLERIEAYEWIPEAPVVDRLAAALSLHAGKLRLSAEASCFPAHPWGTGGNALDVRMLILGDDFLMNGYVVTCRRTGEAAIVDPGFQGDRLLSAAREAGARVGQVWLTHGHGDHVGDLPLVLDATGAGAAIGDEDLPLTGGLAGRIEERLTPGGRVDLGEQRFTIAATPGHTPGGVSLIHDEAAFVGDALFAGSLGGTRRRADYDRQRRAVAAELLSLPPATTLYPGHGPATTVGEERRTNPFFD